MIYMISLLATALCAVGIVRWRSFFETLTEHRADNIAIQSSHCGDPLRFGGLAVFIGLGFGTFLLLWDLGGNRATLLVLSSLPVAIAGLAEDMGYRVSPRGRLVAAMVSALTAIALLQMWIPRADLAGLDFVLAFPAIAIAGTILFSACYCHSLNLIDGMNGLATVAAITAATGIATIATIAGQAEIATFAILLIACLIGFLLLNWPSAHLFLGDAGAYAIGHLLVWLCIILANVSQDIAIPALLLVLFWPLADVFHTIYRRAILSKSLFQPDKMHLHHKVRRALDLVVFGYNQRAKSNPSTTAVLLPFMIMPVATGVLLWNDPREAWLAFFAFLIAFALAHKVATGIAVKYRK